MQTTLFALLKAADVIEIDGYEVDECNYLPDNTVRLDYCGGDERTLFADQPVSFDHGACRANSRADPEYDGEGDIPCDLTFKVIHLLQPEDL
jgi:hypothetical protein